MNADCDIHITKLLDAWTNSLRQMHLTVEFAFIGDSLTYWGNFDHVLSPHSVCNLGLRGDNLEGINKRIHQLNIVSPETVFIMVGLNDLPLQPEEFKSKYETLMGSIKKTVPYSKIIIQSILPVNDVDYSISCSNKDIDEANLIIRDSALQYDYEYWDLNSLYKGNGYLLKEFTSDGIHLTDSGYQIWYKQLSNII